LLAGRAQKRTKKVKRKAGSQEQGDHSDEEEEEEEVNTRRTGPWVKKNPNLIGSKIPDFKKPDQPAPELTPAVATAYDYYKLFQSEKFVDLVIEQSKLYAGQKDMVRQASSVDKDTYRCTEAVLLLSGYATVPRRKMLWERSPDCFNKLVADNVRRTQVDAVLSCLHFRDNAEADQDSYYKVRPIFDNLNEASSKFSRFCTADGKYSVDEMMLPYYGRHSSRQFIMGKPIRCGYKVKKLILCTVYQYRYNFPKTKFCYEGKKLCVDSKKVFASRKKIKNILTITKTDTIF